MMLYLKIWFFKENNGTFHIKIELIAVIFQMGFWCYFTFNVMPAWHFDILGLLSTTKDSN